VSYLPYVIGAYAVFAIVLAWDFLLPRLQLRQLLRNARQRQARAQARRVAASTQTELPR
jgi:heme exporter protein D